MDIKSGIITDIGANCIWYTYNGDEVTWNGSMYISLLSCGEFKTLDDLDKAHDYIKRTLVK